MNETKSVKSLKKQLAAAIAMVCVAAIALGSSTYAWFASNNTVSANGMSITAETEGANLEVSFVKDTFTAGTVAVDATEEMKNITLKPTHYVTSTDAANSNTYGAKSITAGNWAHALSGEYDQVSTANTYTEATTVDAVGTLGDTASHTEYALIVPVYLRLNDNSGNQINNIKASATITHTPDGSNMTTAGRVAFITQDGKNNKTILDGTGYTSGQQTTSSVASITAAGNAGAKVVYVVIYFDGDDPTCKSSNFNSDQYTVNLTFTGTPGEDIGA